ncbi:hypothetical protein LEP1GSC062_1061 [Leptospira alexanderi serovar Manhao 3 str. L 60]|uniref:Uncharacterized protein n=2 Tax=Leptospira alexanderi TaxID=100053 RepID=V6I7W1_9LEPT|nr:hypothetical protein LEP1GSC062_1061 [Leptospira alexanderi serovar Manhao 3 str. L 60]
MCTEKISSWIAHNFFVFLSEKPILKGEMDVSLEEKLNQIEISFRNYILILDFLIRETRAELSENRAKREVWQEHHQNWKQSNKVFKNISL